MCLKLCILRGINLSAFTNHKEIIRVVIDWLPFRSLTIEPLGKFTMKDIRCQGGINEITVGTEIFKN